MQKVVKMIKKIEKLVFFWDSTIKPWSVDIRTIMDYWTGLSDMGVRCELIDTKDMAGAELERWRMEARIAAMWRHQEVRRPFDRGLLDFGKQVPALLVYEEGEKVATAVYPHSEKRGQKRTDYSIEDFLKELTDSLGG